MNSIVALAATEGNSAVLVVPDVELDDLREEDALCTEPALPCAWSFDR